VISTSVDIYTDWSSQSVPTERHQRRNLD